MLRACMEVMQPARGTNANLQALFPAKRRVIGVVEMVAEGATLHEVVD